MSWLALVHFVYLLERPKNRPLKLAYTTLSTLAHTVLGVFQFSWCETLAFLMFFFSILLDIDPIALTLSRWYNELTITKDGHIVDYDIVIPSEPKERYVPPEALGHWFVFAAPERARRLYSTRYDGKIPLKTLNQLIRTKAFRVVVDDKIYGHSEVKPIYRFSALGFERETDEEMSYEDAGMVIMTYPLESKMEKSPIEPPKPLPPEVMDESESEDVVLTGSAAYLKEAIIMKKRANEQIEANFRDAYNGYLLNKSRKTQREEEQIRAILGREDRCVVTDSYHDDHVSSSDETFVSSHVSRSARSSNHSHQSSFKKKKKRKVSAGQKKRNEEYKKSKGRLKLDEDDFPAMDKPISENTLKEPPNLVADEEGDLEQNSVSSELVDVFGEKPPRIENSWASVVKRPVLNSVRNTGGGGNSGSWENNDYDKLEVKLTDLSGLKITPELAKLRKPRELIDKKVHLICFSFDEDGWTDQRDQKDKKKIRSNEEEYIKTVGSRIVARNLKLERVEDKLSGPVHNLFRSYKTARHMRSSQNSYFLLPVLKKLHRYGYVRLWCDDGVLKGFRTSGDIRSMHNVTNLHLTSNGATYGRPPDVTKVIDDFPPHYGPYL